MSSYHSLKTNLSFSGGGTASITIGTGVVTALVKNIQNNNNSEQLLTTLNDNVTRSKNSLGIPSIGTLSFAQMSNLTTNQIEDMTTLGSYLSRHVNIVSGNSGGSWFHTLMQYSPAFFHMLNNGAIAAPATTIPSPCCDVSQKMRYDSEDYYDYLDNACKEAWITDGRAHSDSGRSRYAVNQTAWDYCSDLDPLQGQGHAPPPLQPQNSYTPRPCSSPDQDGKDGQWNRNGTSSDCAKVDITPHTWRPDEYKYSCKCPTGYSWSDEGYGTRGYHHATGKCNQNCATKMLINRGNRGVPTFKDYIVRQFNARYDPAIDTFQSQNSILEFLLRTAVGHRRPGPCIGSGGCAINNHTDNEMLRYFYWFIRTPWSQVVTEMVFAPADTMVGISYTSGIPDPRGILGRKLSQPVVNGTSIVYAGVAMEDSFVTPTLMGHLFFPTCCPANQRSVPDDAPMDQCIQDHLSNVVSCGAGFPVTFNYNNIKAIDLIEPGETQGSADTALVSHCPMYPGPGNVKYQYEDYSDVDNPVMIGQPAYITQLKNPISPDIQAIDVASIAGAAGALTASAPYLMNVGDQLAQNLGPSNMGDIQDILTSTKYGFDFVELKNILAGAQEGRGFHNYIHGEHPSWKRYVAIIGAIGGLVGTLFAPITAAGYVAHKASCGASTSAVGSAVGSVAGAVTSETDMPAATQALKHALIAISKLLIEEAILVQFNVPNGHIEAGQYNFEFQGGTRGLPGQKSMRIKGAVCTETKKTSWGGCSPISTHRVSNNSAAIDVDQNRTPPTYLGDTDQGLMEHLSFRFGDGGYADNGGVAHAIATFQHAMNYRVRGRGSFLDARQELLDTGLCYHGVHVGKAGQRDWTVNSGSCNSERNNVYMNPDDTVLFGCHKPDGTQNGLHGCVSARDGPSSAGCLAGELDPAWHDCGGDQKCFNYLPHDAGEVLPPIPVILPECLSRDPAELDYTHIWSGYKKLQKHKWEWYGGEYAEAWPTAECETNSYTQGYSDMTNAQKQETTWWNQSNFMNIYHVRTVTVDNPAFGITAGMKVDLYFIHVETASPTFPDPTVENVTGVNTYTISAFDIAQLMDAAFAARPGLLEDAFFNVNRTNQSMLNNRTGPGGGRAAMQASDTWRSSLNNPQGQLNTPYVHPPDEGAAVENY